GPILDQVGHSREPIPYTRTEDLEHDIDSGMASINVYNDRQTDGIATHYPNGVVHTVHDDGSISYTPPPGGSIGTDKNGLTTVKDANGKVVAEVGPDLQFHVHTKFGEYTQQDFGSVAFLPKPGKQLDTNQLHKSGAVTPNHFEDYGIASDGKTMRFPNGVEYDVKNGMPILQPNSFSKEVQNKDGSHEYYMGDTLIARTDSKGLHVPTPDGMITVAKGQVAFAKNPPHHA